jgi:hypothetical protein
VSPLDGIPVWPLAAVWCPSTKESGICYAMTTAGKPLVMVRDGNALQPSHHDLPWLLDLSNPDTHGRRWRAEGYSLERLVLVEVAEWEP